MSDSHGHIMARSARAPLSVLVAALLTALLALPAVSSGGASTLRSVVVIGEPGAVAVLEDAVDAVGGTVSRVLGIIDGVAAEVPADSVDELLVSPGVVSVTPDSRLQPKGVYTGFDHTAYGGSLHRITGEVIEADSLWGMGYTGRGVDVAVIDTGVTEVPGLDVAGKVLHGPDLSFESQDPATAYVDSYGHGTHMAGIIAGRDSSATLPVTTAQPENFLGVAPGARIVSLKVGDRTGATDVSQVIAAIDWVVQHRNTDGLNIRVLNLSYGTDSDQSYTLDPLAYAAEVAWRKGIVVVAAAGNAGNGSPSLDNPAYNPNILAVGGADGKGTDSMGDDEVPSWSSCGDGTRNPDLVAPGAGILSLRVPGSYIDTMYPEARKSDSLVRGSGTSQATAIVSGAAALLLEQRPHLTPNDVKEVLRGATKTIKSTDPKCQGKGQMRLAGINGVHPTGTLSSAKQATGRGSLEQSRGSYHLVERVYPTDGSEPYDVVLQGEVDIFGQAWDGSRWTQESWAGTSWSAEGDWNGSRWTGADWNGSRWTGSRWTGSRWTGSRWTGSRWTTAEGYDTELGMVSGWTGSRWTAEYWAGSRWTTDLWAGSRWTGDVFETGVWSGSRWG